MPMNFSVLKLTRRSIRSSFGRFAALLLIVTLSVGFFSGLKITKTAMAETCSDYLAEHNFYDYRLLSTIGFTGDDEKEFKGLSSVENAEGGKSLDALINYDGKTAAYKMICLHFSSRTTSFFFKKVSKKYMLPHASIAMIQNESTHNAMITPPP